MADSKITVIGTGLIGASVGLNLMSKADRRYEVVGLDNSRQNVRTAKEMGAIDRSVRSLEEAVDGASMIILAVPVRVAEGMVTAMKPWIAEGAIVTDTCSTKASFMSTAEEVLGGFASVIGGHPMAGSDESGPASARVDLFKGAAWAVTPSALANERSIDVVLGLIESAGAVPIYIDPAEHDELVAPVSHVPLLLSVALFRMARDSACWEDAQQLSGPAFRQFTRLAKGDPQMSTDIVSTNREAIVSWLQRYRDELGTIIKAIDVGDDAVEDLFKRTQFEREVFDLATVGRKQPAANASAPSAAEMTAQLFVGGAIYDRLKEMNQGDRDQSDRGELRRKLGIDEDGDRKGR